MCLNQPNMSKSKSTSSSSAGGGGGAYFFLGSSFFLASSFFYSFLAGAGAELAAGTFESPLLMTLIK